VGGTVAHELHLESIFWSDFVKQTRPRDVSIFRGSSIREQLLQIGFSGAVVLTKTPLEKIRLSKQ
jgi:hypothetical protein